MIKNTIIALAMTLATGLSYAADASNSGDKQAFKLKDGSTVHVFKNGKMSMEDKNGQVKRMKHGEVMETQDGQKLMMHGDEVMRLESLMNKDRKGG